MVWLGGTTDCPRHGEASEASEELVLALLVAGPTFQDSCLSHTSERKALERRSTVLVLQRRLRMASGY